MLDLSLFRKRGFVGVSLTTFAIGAGMFAMYPYITLYLQNDLGYSPLAGGVRLLPSTVLLFIVPLATRSVVERFAPGAVLGFGMLVTGVGIASMANLSTGSTWTHLIPGPVANGLRHRHRQPRDRQDRAWEWWSPSEAAWPRVSATPSGSADSPRVSPPWARSSNTR